MGWLGAFPHDRWMETMIHRASALGGCLKGQIAAALGEKPIPIDDVSLTRMGEGQLHEDDVIARLMADGHTVTRQQEEVNLDHLAMYEEDEPSWRVRGHLDGIVNGDPFTPSGPRVLEVKSMSDSAFKAFQAKGWHGDWPEASLPDRYRWQVSVYMLATGLEALLVCKNRNSGEIAQHGIETPYYSLDQITERVAYLEDHIQRGVLPDKCPRSFFCDYKYLCTREDKPVNGWVAQPAPTLIQQYVELGDTIKDLEAQRDVIKAELPTLLGTAQSVQWDGYKATRVTQNRKERVVPASTVTFIKVTKEGT